MVRIQIGSNTYTIDSVQDIADIIRKFILPAHPYTINTIEDQDGTLIIVSDVETLPSSGTTGKKK